MAEDSKKIEEQLRRDFAFDQYGRYAIIRDIINCNRKDGEVFKVLDVGGRGNILKKFIENDEVYYLDPFVDSSDENFIKGDGCAMDMKNESFDWVVSADVFEHIPPEKRKDFLRENMRVARLGVVLVAPMFSDEVAAAEINANESFKILSGGKDHPWLIEHIQNGLPDEKMILDFINGNDYRFQKINNNTLILWQIFLGIELLSEGDSDLKEEFKELNSFYNSEVFPFDTSEPSYRKVYFIKKDFKLSNIEVKNKPLNDILFLKTIQKGINLLYRIDVKNRSLLRDYLLKVEEKEGIIEKLKSYGNDPESLKQKLSKKNEEIETMKSSKFWKMRGLYLRIKKYYPLYFLDLFKKAVNVLKKEGSIVFLRYSYKFIIHGRKYFSKNVNYLESYHYWINKNENYKNKDILRKISQFLLMPKFAILLVGNFDNVYDFNASLSSIREQFYTNWRIYLLSNDSLNNGTRKKIEALINYGEKITLLENIHEYLNKTLDTNLQEYVTIVRIGDKLPAHALLEVASCINSFPSAKIIFGDEDKIDESEVRRGPFFKPDWSLDLFLSYNYLGYACYFCSSFIHTLNDIFKEKFVMQAYDIVLKAIALNKNEEIKHIAKIIYSSKKYRNDPDDISNKSKGYLTNYLKDNKIEASIEDGIYPSSFRVRRIIKDNFLISIIIPFRDQVDILKRCLDSIRGNTDYKNYEIILVDNQSSESKTHEYLKEIEKIPTMKILKYDKPFNFSAINNFAVNRIKNEYILFLNNDTEVINSDWLTAMAEHIQREEIGAVGAKLIYPNGTIQHAGVIVGLGGVAGHAFKGYHPYDGFAYGQINEIRNYSAVTAACMLTKKSLFLETGGFNEINLAIAYNDLDYCLKIVEKGYKIVYTPYAELYHHESVSRGNDDDLKFTNPIKYKRVISERNYIKKKWKKHINHDPFYNPNLTKCREDFSIDVT